MGKSKIGFSLSEKYAKSIFLLAQSVQAQSRPKAATQHDTHKHYFTYVQRQAVAAAATMTMTT
jgi:hypothetical protein